MKKWCLKFFHDWSEWGVDSDDIINIYREFHVKGDLPIRRERIIIQTRQCKNCNYKQFKREKLSA